MATQLPWFKTWPTTFIAETSHLSAAETGAYFTLLCRYWMNGNTLPSDTRLLTRWAKCDDATCESVVREFFTVEGNSLAHSAMNAARAESIETCEKNTQRAKYAAKQRWSSSSQACVPHAPSTNEDADGINEHAWSIPEACSKTANKEVDIEADEEGDSEGEAQTEADGDAEENRRSALEKAQRAWQTAAPEDKPKRRAAFYQLRREIRQEETDGNITSIQ